MKNRYRKFRSLPIFGLIAASFLLLVILAVLTYMKINREKELLKYHLSRQGITIIRALEAGARTGMMKMMWGENQVQTLFAETAKGPNIDQIFLVNEQGNILVHSIPGEVGHSIRPFVVPDESNPAVWDIYKKPDGENSFRVIKKFEPLAAGSKSMMGRRMRRWNRSRGRYQQRRMECHLNAGDIIPLSTTSSFLQDEKGTVIGTGPGVVS